MAVLKKPFSKPHGYPGQAPDITIREDAPESLRYFFLQTGIDLIVGLAATVATYLSR